MQIVELLPVPLAVLLARDVSSKVNDRDEMTNAPTADDEVSGMNTYTDDF